MQPRRSCPCKQVISVAFSILESTESFSDRNTQINFLESSTWVIGVFGSKDVPKYPINIARWHFGLKFWCLDIIHCAYTFRIVKTDEYSLETKFFRCELIWWFQHVTLAFGETKENLFYCLIFFSWVWWIHFCFLVITEPVRKKVLQTDSPIFTYQFLYQYF